MKATEEVKLIQGTRIGKCDEMEADFDGNTFILYGRGRLATIEDKSSQQVAKGAVLTFDGGADRILVESETGGRTWVTLEPRPRKGKQSDPESPR